MIGSGSVVSQPAQATYHYDDAVILTATPSVGWTFANWSGGASGFLTQTTVVITQHTTVTATFTQNDYTLVPTVIGSGFVVQQPAQASYHYGDVVTLTATPSAGWSFGGWSGAASGVLTQTTVTITGSTIVTATFIQNNYTLSVGVIGNGSVVSQPAQSTYHYNDIVTLTAIANTGWSFNNWSGTSCTISLCVLTIQGNTAVTATFNGSTGTTPCANPVTFTNQSGNFNTSGAICLRTTATVNGWGCSNFAGRTVSVNGGTATTTCGAGPFPLPKSADGYTYFSVTAGSYPWASIYAW